MTKKQYVFGVVALCSAGSLVITRAQNQKAPPQPMGFFVTSAGPGKGAELGGVAGADQHCQQLAAAAVAGGRTGRAYLSTGGQAAMSARDRIGQGPWYNAQDAWIPQSLDDLPG